MMTRTHISKDRELTLKPRRYTQKIGDKPQGLWYGVDGDWERWCRAEEWGLNGTMYEHELVLGKSKILRVVGSAEVDAFHEEYKAQHEYMKPNPLFRNEAYIDWARVASEYDGIEIAPYISERPVWSRRSRWYCTWDCASGCLWRLKGTTVKLLKSVCA